MTSEAQRKSIEESGRRSLDAYHVIGVRFRKAAACTVQQARAVIAAAVITSLIPLNVGNAYAQEVAPQLQGAPQRLAAAEINQLVAPIALYPDALVAQILAASAVPLQVVEADRFVKRSAGMPPQELAHAADAQPWDPSVKALTAFPAVLANMSNNLAWTDNLGAAYYNQPQEVMGSVQAMRQRAYAAGTLRTTPQEAVIYQPGNIVIQPVSPTIIYVPVYNPWVVYGAPVPVYAAYIAPPPPAGSVATAAAIGFTAGVLVAAFSSYGWGCTHWTTNWYSHAVIYNHAAYVARSGYGYHPGYGYHGGYGNPHGNYGDSHGGYGYRGGYGSDPRGGGYNGGHGGSGNGSGNSGGSSNHGDSGTGSGGNGTGTNNGSGSDHGGHSGSGNGNNPGASGGGSGSPTTADRNASTSQSDASPTGNMGRSSRAHPEGGTR